MFSFSPEDATEIAILLGRAAGKITSSSETHNDDPGEDDPGEGSSTMRDTARRYPDKPQAEGLPIRKLVVTCIL